MSSSSRGEGGAASTEEARRRRGRRGGVFDPAARSRAPVARRPRRREERHDEAEGEDQRAEDRREDEEPELVEEGELAGQPLRPSVVAAPPTTVPPIFDTALTKTVHPRRVPGLVRLDVHVALLWIA